MRTRMVADVGGTNTRIALYDAHNGELRALRTYINRDYARFEEVIGHWLDQLTEPTPDEACIAVAAPPTEDFVDMMNMDWAFSQSQLTRQFGFRSLRCINDFQAIAFALPYLTDSDRVVLNSGTAGITGKLAAVGPGTGLGGATIESHAGEFLVSACEPGHMGLAPATALELALFETLNARYGSVYVELLCCGPGLLRLYETLCELRGQRVDARSPAEISARAEQGQDECCTLALAVFFELLGSACGDFVLANGAYGGLFLAGGIIPRMLPALESSGFLRRFFDKGAMGDHLRAVPVYVITTKQPGLIGAAHAPSAADAASLARS